MRRALSSWRERCGPILLRLDRVAQTINPLLLVAAVVLALINISCYTALRLSRSVVMHAQTSEPEAPGVNRVPVTGPP
jgi:hypothetical protein